MDSTLPSAADLTLAQQVSLLSGGSFWTTQEVAEPPVPAAKVSDGPHGLRTQAGRDDAKGDFASDPATCFPTAVTLASSWDETLVREVGAALGREALAAGVDVVLGPGLNIKRHPLGGRSFEYFSEDPLLSGRLAAAVVEGIQSAGVGACVKHFAVNNQESHRFVVDAVVDERTLRELYLAGFEYAVTVARPWTVMTSYNVVNGVPASEQHTLITRVLRGEWGFDGLVMSDWGAVCDRVAGVRAGMDLEMPGTQGFHDRAVLDAVAGGRLSPDDVASCAQRVLDLVARSPRATPTELSSDEVDAHDALARRAAAESAVLLTNDGALPIAGDTTVALIGGFATEPRFQGSGSSRVNPRRVTTALEALRDRGIEVTEAPGYLLGVAADDGTLLDEAVRAARSAEVAVVMVGLPGTYESEGFDRDDLHLPPEHDALVAAVCAVNPRTVVVLSNGAPVTLPWADEPAAILECYLGGQASGAALADVLVGDVEPGGRLAETFPVRREDLTADAWFPGEAHQVQHREGSLVGYRDLTTRGVAAAFPFGHGLGYSSMEWSEVSLDVPELDVAGLDPEIGATAVRVSLVVTNPGERDGSDVVQVYLHDRTGVVARPHRTLAGFAKVRLAAGATQQVTVDVPLRALAFWDVDHARWRVPSGDFEIEVARSSEDVVETLPLSVEGGVTTAPAGARGPLGDTSDGVFERALGHPVPEARPTTPYSRRSTLEEISATLAGRAFRQLVWRAAPIDETTRSDPAAMTMYERSIDELPLYGAANFGDGLLRPAVIDALVDLMNGPPVRGVSRAVLGLTRSGLGWAVGVGARLVRR